MSSYDVLFLECRAGSSRTAGSAYVQGLAEILGEMGASWACLDHAGDEDALLRRIEAASPRLVIAPPRYAAASLPRVAARLPRVRFGMRTLCGWSQMAEYHELPIWIGWLDAVRRLRNCVALANSAKMLATLASMPGAYELPNVYPGLPQRFPTRADAPGIRVGLAGRLEDTVKGTAAAALALAMIGRKWTLDVHVWLPVAAGWEGRKGTECLMLLGSRLHVHDYEPDGECLRRSLADLGIDCGLFPTSSESFGYAAADFLAAGIPVVGTPALTFLPAQWQVADPGNAYSLMHTLIYGVWSSPAKVQRRLIRETFVADQAARRERARATLEVLL
jgi:glycosyltransferase involved in cell wall biosynthesis